jgi:arginine/lysine/ornithine decarboxylase
MRCKVCSKVESRENLLIPKLDFLLKHSGKRKVTFVIFGVKVGEFYKNKKCAHAKNQVFFTQIPTDSVLQLVINQGVVFNKRKFV